MVDSATILEINDKSGFFRLKLPRGTKSGLIYKAHLSDMDTLNDTLFEYYKQVKFMRNLLVINKQSLSEQIGVRTKISRTSVVLSLKSTLIEFYNSGSATIPKSFEELSANTWFRGWTRKCLDSGVLVELLANLNGFCPNGKITYLDEFKSTVQDGLTEGQSVLVKVCKLFADKKRFTTDFKTRFDATKTSDLDVAFMVDLVKSSLVNIKRLFTFYAEQTSPNPSFWENAARKVQVCVNLFK